MADTLLSEDAEAHADAEAEGRTSEIEDVTGFAAPETEGSPEGETPAEGDDEGGSESDSEEGQDESGEGDDEGKDGSLDDLALDEGSPLTEEYLGEVVAFAKEHSLSTDQAKALLSRDEARASAADEGWRDTTSRWKEEFTSDKEFGGKNLKESLGFARAALSKFGPEGFIARLDASGFGNHPDILRFAANVGKRMSESAKVVKGGKTSDDTGPTWETLFTESGPPPSRAASHA